MALRRFLMAFRPKQNVLVAIYGVPPPTYGVSPETNVVVAIYIVSPLICDGSPETNVVEIIHLLRYAVYFLRLAQNIRQRNHLLIALHHLPFGFRPKHASTASFTNGLSPISYRVSQFTFGGSPET